MFSTLTNLQPMVEFYLLTFSIKPARIKVLLRQDKNQSHEFRTINNKRVRLPCSRLWRRVDARKVELGSDFLNKYVCVESFKNPVDK